MISAKRARKGKFSYDYVILRNIVEQIIMQNSANGEYSLDIVKRVRYSSSVDRLVSLLVSNGYKVVYRYEDGILHLIVRW